MAPMRYRAFISYSHKDEWWAAWLHKALEAYRLPRGMRGRSGSFGLLPERLSPIFRDREELASASDLGRQVNAALAESETLIVVCSPHSAASRWVNEEVLAFKRLGRGERIYCVIVGGEPNASTVPGRDAEECFCPALRFRLDEAGELGMQCAEPIAADARPQGDGKAGARLKLIAGMLGVGLDDLRHREQQRQQRRMWAVTAMAMVVMAVTSTLAVMAYVAREAAERRQRQAEELVGFMLGDLTDKLNEVSRLDILEGVANKAHAYYESLPQADLTSDSRLGRARNLLKIASVQVERGKLERALDTYLSAADLLNPASAADRDNATLLVLYAESQNYVGTMRWQLMDFQGAESAFASAHEALGKAITITPDDHHLAKQLAYQKTNHGRLLERQGRLHEAQALYLEVLAIFRRLSEAEPGKRLWQSELGFANNNIGKVAERLGDLASALRHYRDDAGIKRLLQTKDPVDNNMAFELARSLLILMPVLNATGSAEEAERLGLEALSIFERLRVFDPQQTKLHGFLYATHVRLCRIAHELQNLTAAAAQCERALTSLARWEQATPNQSGIALRQAEATLLAAEVAQQRGLNAKASEQVERVTTMMAHWQGDAADRPQADRVHARLALLQSQLQPQHSEARRLLLLQAMQILDSYVETTMDFESLDIWVRASVLAGQADRTRPIVARLARSGYAPPTFTAFVTKHRLRP